MAKINPANEARLRAAIAEHNLQIVEEQIVAATRECAALITTVPETYERVGTSRYGGVPDLPPGEDLWAQTKSGKFYNFYLQLNLGDLPDFIGNVLPRQGMLYLFIADYDDAKVIYADVDPSILVKAEPKDPGEYTGWDPDTLNPYRIDIRASLSVPEWYNATYGAIESILADTYTDEKEYESVTERLEDFARSMVRRNESEQRAGELLANPAYIGYDPVEDGEVEGDHDTLLLMLTSDRKVGTLFGDAGYIHLFINHAALEAHDFSDIEMRLESS